MTKRRWYPCARPGCRRRACILGGCCSRSCARRLALDATPPEARSAQMRRARQLQQQQQINRMLQRVKALADGEDARLVLAWRYGKGSLKSARHRAKQKGAHVCPRVA